MSAYDVIVICGPTASGKTALSVDIAEKIGGEIVSADSMQIYKEMNIGTAKPDISERKGISHHNIDIISVSEEYNVSKFVETSQKCIDDIISRGKTPVIVGGTGLYIDSLINNVSFVKIETDLSYREYLNNLAAQKGNAYIHNILKQKDPVAAVEIHPNNLKRVIRALELIAATGLTIEEVKKQSVQSRKYKPLFIGLNFKDRNLLYDRINKRCDVMVANGLLCEAKELYSLELSATAIGAIGYKEIFKYFDGEISLDESVELIKKNSRNYAKRQLTWFNRNSEINWFYPDDYSDYGLLFDDVMKLIESQEV